MYREYEAHLAKLDDYMLGRADKWFPRVTYTPVHIRPGNTRWLSAGLSEEKNRGLQQQLAAATATEQANKTKYDDLEKQHKDLAELYDDTVEVLARRGKQNRVKQAANFNKITKEKLADQQAKIAEAAAKGNHALANSLKEQAFLTKFDNYNKNGFVYVFTPKSAKTQIIGRSKNDIASLIVDSPDRPTMPDGKPYSKGQLVSRIGTVKFTDVIRLNINDKTDLALLAKMKFRNPDLQ